MLYRQNPNLAQSTEPVRSLTAISNSVGLSPTFRHPDDIADNNDRWKIYEAPTKTRITRYKDNQKKKLILDSAR